VKFLRLLLWAILLVAGMALAFAAAFVCDLCDRIDSMLDWLEPSE
jgi:hypothetical protein